MAILKSDKTDTTTLAIKDKNKLSLASKVITLGYPLSDLLGSGIKYTDGSVSSLSGLFNDTRYLQFSAPVQPGNSGDRYWIQMAV